MRANALDSGLVSQNQFALPPLHLLRPTSVKDAVRMVAAHPEAVIAAGCIDLVAQFREGCVPRTLVSLQKVAALREISHDSGLLRIGPMVTHHVGSSSPIVAEAIPSLARAWESIATVRIRYSATVGGNLMARRYRYELPLMLGALGAELTYASGAARADVADLWDPVRADQPALLTGIEVRTADLAWFGYERSLRPVATVAIAIRRRPDGRLGIQAQAGSEYRHGFALHAVAEPGDFDPSCLSRELASQLPAESADYTGSWEYRRHLVTVLSGRLLVAARTQLTGGGTP